MPAIHKSAVSLLTLILLPTLFRPQPALADYAVTVDPGTRYQTLEGWETSLAWWPNVVGGFPDSYRADYVNKIFDPVQGLGLNIVRYNIGGGDNPKYAPPNNPFLGLRESVPGYEPAPGKWDWSVDANQRRVLFESIKKGVNVFEAFSNSPPYWMTNSGSVTGRAGGGDNLNPRYNQDFADYLTTVVKHFHDDWGITFRTLDPLNEPSGTWWNQQKHQEGCHFSRPAQIAIINATAASLAVKGMKYTAVSASDESFVEDTVKTWNAYDAPARAAVAQINTHTYSSNQRAELQDIDRTTGKRLWMSEDGEGDGTGMRLSEEILSDMKVMRPVAWVYWQAVDGGGWGLLANPLRTATSYAYTVNEKYYVFGQYTKFIRPGDTIIDSDDPQTLAACNAKSGKLVLVTTNNTNAPTVVTFSLSRFRRLPPVAQATQTSPTQCLAAIPRVVIRDRKFLAALPAHSVTTFVLAGASQ